jgi:hypothetical protein
VQSVRLRARQSACLGGEDRAKSRQLADRCRGDMSVAGKQLMAESQAVVATIAKLLVEALDMWAILVVRRADRGQDACSSTAPDAGQRGGSSSARPCSMTEGPLFPA